MPLCRLRSSSACSSWRVALCLSWNSMAINFCPVPSSNTYLLKLFPLPRNLCFDVTSMLLVSMTTKLIVSTCELYCGRFIGDGNEWTPDKCDKVLRAGEALKSLIASRSSGLVVSICVNKRAISGSNRYVKIGAANNLARYSLSPTR